MMMMMTTTTMTINEFPLLWHEILRLQGHVILYKQSHAVVSVVQC